MYSYFVYVILLMESSTSVVTHFVEEYFVDNVYWKHVVHHIKACKVVLHGHAEFGASDVIIKVIGWNMETLQTESTLEDHMMIVSDVRFRTNLLNRIWTSMMVEFV